MTIGERLRAERTRLGLSQTEFGAIGGVAANAQGNYESDKRSPDAAYLAKIGQFGADVLYIVSGVRAREIDLTLFGMCEMALRMAYGAVRPNSAPGRAFRTNQLCKLYNSVAAQLKPEDNAAAAVNEAAELLVMWANDPSDPDQLDRVLLQPSTSTPANNVTDDKATRNVVATGGSIAVGRNMSVGVRPKRGK